jgi:hypothetical protein
MKDPLARVIFIVVLALVIGVVGNPEQSNCASYWCAGHRLIRFQNPYDAAHVAAHYAVMLRTAHIEQDFIPTLSAGFRL